MFLDSYVMPHGDFSDYAAFVCLGSGFASIFKPNLWFTGLGPIKPFFDSGDTPQTLAVIQFTGSLLLVCSSTFNYLCRKRSYLAFLLVLGVCPFCQSLEHRQRKGCCTRNARIKHHLCVHRHGPRQLCFRFA